MVLVPRCLAHSRCSPNNVCTAQESSWANRKRNRGFSRQEEAGNRNGLVGISWESWPGTLHREANSVFRRCWRFLGGKRRGVTSKVPRQSGTWRGDKQEREGGALLSVRVSADQEEGLLSGMAGPCRSRGLGFRCPLAARLWASDQAVPSLSWPVWKMGQRCRPRGAMLTIKRNKKVLLVPPSW